jgi:hypothetical protein
MNPLAASTQMVDSPDLVTEPSSSVHTPLPIHLVDACGSGYTAEDLVRTLASVREDQ